MKYTARCIVHCFDGKDCAVLMLVHLPWVIGCIGDRSTRRGEVDGYIESRWDAAREVVRSNNRLLPQRVCVTHVAASATGGDAADLSSLSSLEAERRFRDMKSALLLRPAFHRLEHRIRAHVLLCWLALLLTRIAERRTGTTWRRIATDLGRVHAVSLTGSVGTAVHTTPRSTAQADIFRQCQVVPPAAITPLDPG